jgi:hypothetical protein
MGVLTVISLTDGKISQEFHRENAVGIIFRKSFDPPADVLPSVLGCRAK